ncbi:AAA-domain-containing protein [Hypoxylon sp. FL0890]|nr:AAA-domain-containing protein [Hypoxylon sp. FL0890]
MHNLSLRAFRSVALTLQKPPIATRSGQFFHASARARAADGSPSAPSAPRDDGNKPEREDGENGDENLFGENAATANAEGQGRKRSGNGSLRSRTLRNRKPEELPPIHVPKSFLANAISRLEDSTNGAGSNHVHEKHVRIMLERMLLAPERIWDEHLPYIIEATSWTEETLTETLKALESSLDGELVRKKGDVLVAAAFWAIVLSARMTHGKEAVDKLLEQNSISNSGDFLTAITYGGAFGQYDRLRRPDQAKDVIQAAINDSLLEASAVTWFEEDLIEEIVASVNTDLLVQAPKYIKLADLRRPVTIINISNYSGYSVPHEIVQHIGVKLGADVLHLRASDIAHIVGSYLGQDPVRAPGVISQLGYKAAENSGRLKQNRAANEDADDMGDIRGSYTIIMRDERLRKENKRYISLMDEFLNGPNRGKNDDIWEDLKVNTALEELIHAADSKSTEKRPLIVHIDDFNAINMDLECGAMIIGKIRKVVDGLWVEGRKIALVGTCSTKGASRPYLNNLRELETTERVTTLGAITLDTIPPDSSPAQWAKVTTLGVIRKYRETEDNVRENESNIVRVLSSMIEPPSESAVVTSGKIGMTEIDIWKLPKSWIKGVLPLAEVYRIATAMVGYSKDPSGVFNIETLEKAADVIKRLEHLKERYSILRSREEKKQQKESTEFLDVRKLNSSEENHEERMESGLVNAKDIRTTFKDVHAPKETIESVKMLTTLSLIRPEAFSYGVLATERIPGCLLYGPPGTGKTLLAKAVAKESGANMIEISGASINHKYVGESEKNVRALFQLAKKKEPMVIFIDEADALLGARGRRDLGSRRETINQFLREWDGMDKMKAFIMVATNRPFDLDEAVLRRLPRKLLIDLPLEADRAAILRIHLKDELLDEETVSIDDIAKRTPLYSGSDLKNVCVAAAMAAVKEELELEEQQKRRQEQQAQADQTGNSSTNSGGGDGGKKKRRVLAGRHFDKALQEIGASVSEDMATLTAIRKFDEKYGDGGAARHRKRKGMGFEVAAEVPDTQEARVRKGQ